MPDTLTQDMPIKTIAPWFGGKRTLAPRIVELLGEHRAYLEPFVGGVSVLMQKPRSRKETINDLHGELTHLAVVLASPRWRELYSMAGRTLYCEWLYDIAKRELASFADRPVADDPDRVDGDDLKRAWAYLIVSWMGRNGQAGTPTGSKFTTRYTGNGGDSATRWANVTASMPAWHERLIGVDILQRDGVELIQKFEDAAGVAIYCDPPYLDEGDAYEHTFAGDGSGGGMFGDDDDDHGRLAAALNAKKHSRVVVSYYDHPRLATLYPADRWDKHVIPVTKALAAQNRRGANRVKADEVLLVNTRNMEG